MRAKYFVWPETEVNVTTEETRVRTSCSASMGGVFQAARIDGRPGPS